MEDYEKEYEEALKRLTETKEKVAAGNKTIDDLGEAIEEVRFLKKKRRMLREADHLIEQGSEVSIEEDVGEEPEEGFSFDAIDTELEDITEKLKGHKDLKREHAYIIGFKRGEGMKLAISGDGGSLLEMFYSLWNHKPFSSLKPVNEAEAHRVLLNLAKAFKNK